MNSRIERPVRSAFSHFTAVHTRWGDNDAFGHVNNVVYYSYCESTICAYLIEHEALDIVYSPVIGVVVSSSCTYHASVSFPDVITVGMKVTHLGTSSMRYELALFRNDDQQASAVVQMTYVYVDRSTQSPVPIPSFIRDVLGRLLG